MLLIIQSIIVYGLIIWVMTYNAKKVVRRNYIPATFKDFISYESIWIPLLIFSFFSSIRWGVGVDCNNYIANYYGWGIDDTSAMKGEWGFVYLRQLFQTLNLSHVPFFFTLVLFQIGFVYYGLRKKPSMLMFFPIMLFLSNNYWRWMNGVRQMLVCSIFVYILYLFTQKKLYHALIWIFLASLFHKSALILLPLSLVCLYPKILIPNKYIQLAIVVVCYLSMGLSVTKSLGTMVEKVLALVGYDEGNQIHLIDAIIEKTFGFRSMLLLFANCITIYLSTKMQDFYKSNHFNVMYNLYFIGVCAALVFYGNHGIERFLMYFTCFTPIMLSCCAYYLYKHKSNASGALLLYSMIGALLIRTMYEFHDASGKEIEYTLYKTIFTNDIPTGSYYFL